MSDLGQFFDSIGERARRRPSPRLAIAIAAAGVALTVAGALTVSGNELGTGEGSPNRVPGIFLSGAVVAGGYVLLSKYRTGALGAAGVAATVLALPPLMFFITFDANRAELLNVNAILLISVAVWAASYVFGPGRGHSLYLGSALVGLWLFVLNQIEELVTIPGRLFESFFEGFVEDQQTAVDSVNWTNLGMASLVVAVGYLVVSRVLDRRDLDGSATPFVFSGLVALTAALLLLAAELGDGTFGVALIAAGLVTAYFGATAERRGSTWYGGFGVFYGSGTLIDEILEDDVASGLVMIGAGIGLVVLGYLVATKWQEPDELVPGPSTLVISGADGPPPTWQPPPPPDNIWQPPPPPMPPGPPVAPPATRRDRPLRPPGREF